MANIDTLLDDALNDGKIVLTIDEPSRSIVYENGELILGVENDYQAETIFFKIPMIIHMDEDVNLSTDNVEIYVVFTNSNDKTYFIQCAKAADVDEDNMVTFSWLLTKNVTIVRGTVQFSVCVKNIVNGEIANEWHTTPYEGTVLPGLETSDKTPEIIVDETATTYALIAKVESFEKQVAEYDAKINSINAYTKEELDVKFDDVTAKLGELESSVSAATTKASNAITAANEANTKANNADSKADNAISAANEAGTKADNAITVANEANTAAATANALANEANTAATNAATKADDATALANSANSAVEELKNCGLFKRTVRTIYTASSSNSPVSLPDVGNNITTRYVSLNEAPTAGSKLILYFNNENENIFNGTTCFTIEMNVIANASAANGMVGMGSLAILNDSWRGIITASISSSTGYNDSAKALYLAAYTFGLGDASDEKTRHFYLTKIEEVVDEEITNE